jgi:hypothetical protein
VVSRLLHFQSLVRLKMAGLLPRAGNAEFFSVSLGNLEKSHPWDLSRREAKSAISASLHFQVLGHLKMAARPCAAWAP